MTEILIKFALTIVAIFVIFLAVEIWSTVKFIKKMKENENEINQDWEKFKNWLKSKL